jgi:hypothetical protein
LLSSITISFSFTTPQEKKKDIEDRRAKKELADLRNSTAADLKSKGKEIETLSSANSAFADTQKKLKLEVTLLNSKLQKAASNCPDEEIDHDQVDGQLIQSVEKASKTLVDSRCNKRKRELLFLELELELQKEKAEIELRHTRLTAEAELRHARQQVSELKSMQRRAAFFGED